MFAVWQDSAKCEEDLGPCMHSSIQQFFPGVPACYCMNLTCIGIILCNLKIYHATNKIVSTKPHHSCKKYLPPLFAKLHQTSMRIEVWNGEASWRWPSKDTLPVEGKYIDDITQYLANTSKLIRTRYSLPLFLSILFNFCLDTLEVYTRKKTYVYIYK